MKEPQLRFKADDGTNFPDWEEKTFNDIADYKKGPFGSALKKKIFVPKSNNTVKVYEQQNAISKDWRLERYFVTNEYFQANMKSFSVSGGDIIVSCAGTIGEIYELPNDAEEGIINQALMRVRIKKSVINSMVFKCVFDKMMSSEGIKISNGSALKNIPPFADMKKQPVFLPSLPEQQKIASLFTELDNLIQSAENELDGYRELKQGMLQKMFPKKGKTTPEIRFPEFTGDWEQHKLKDMCTIITKQTGFDYSATIKPSLVTTKEDDTYSFIQNKDFEGLNINLETDFYIPISVAEKYPKITLDQPSLLISISGRIGNVGLYSLDSKAFIGGAVGICKLKDIEDGKTALYELSSPAGQMYFNSLIKASSHSNITVEDIRNIEVLLPKHVEEKRKINTYFENLDNLIISQQQELDGYKELKKGLLQQMFC